MNLVKFRRAISLGRFEWRQHVLERLIQRNILQDQILSVLKKSFPIEEYPQDKPYPSALFYGKISKVPIHVVAAFDELNNWVYIITAYVPDLKHFENDYRTRRDKK